MRSLNLALTMFIIAFATGRPAQAQSKCGVAALPSQAQLLVNKRFPDWRIKLPSDLVDFDKRSWAQEHPKECPGIAIGHFEDAGQVACRRTLLYAKM